MKNITDQILNNRSPMFLIEKVVVKAPGGSVQTMSRKQSAAQQKDTERLKDKLRKINQSRQAAIQRANAKTRKAGEPNVSSERRQELRKDAADARQDALDKSREQTNKAQRLFKDKQQARREKMADLKTIKARTGKGMTAIASTRKSFIVPGGRTFREELKEAMLGRLTKGIALHIATYIVTTKGLGPTVKYLVTRESVKKEVIRKIQEELVKKADRESKRLGMTQEEYLLAVKGKIKVIMKTPAVRDQVNEMVRKAIKDGTFDEPSAKLTAFLSVLAQAIVLHINIKGVEAAVEKGEGWLP